MGVETFGSLPVDIDKKLRSLGNDVAGDIFVLDKSLVSKDRNQSIANMRELVKAVSGGRADSASGLLKLLRNEPRNSDLGVGFSKLADIVVSALDTLPSTMSEKDKKAWDRRLALGAGDIAKIDLPEPLKGLEEALVDRIYPPSSKVRFFVDEINNARDFNKRPDDMAEWLRANKNKFIVPPNDPEKQAALCLRNHLDIQQTILEHSNVPKEDREVPEKPVKEKESLYREEMDFYERMLRRSSVIDPLVSAESPFAPPWIRDAINSGRVGTGAMDKIVELAKANFGQYSKSTPDAIFKKSDKPEDSRGGEGHFSAQNREMQMLYEMHGVKETFSRYMDHFFHLRTTPDGADFLTLKTEISVLRDLQSKGDWVRNNLVPELIRGGISELEAWRACAIVDALLFVGNAFESADNLYKVDNADVVVSGTRIWMHPKGRFESKVTNKDIGTEEDVLGGIARWFAERKAQARTNLDSRKVVEKITDPSNNEWKPFPDRLFASIFETTNVRSVAGEEQSLAKALFNGVEIDWNYSYLENGEMKGGPSSNMWSAYLDLADSALKLFHALSGNPRQQLSFKKEDVGKRAAWAKTMFDALQRVKKNKLLKETYSTQMFPVWLIAGASVDGLVNRSSEIRVVLPDRPNMDLYLGQILGTADNVGLTRDAEQRRLVRKIFGGSGMFDSLFASFRTK